MDSSFFTLSCANLCLLRERHLRESLHASCLWCPFRRHWKNKGYTWSKYFGVLLPKKRHIKIAYLPQKRAYYYLIVDDERPLAVQKSILLNLWWFWIEKFYRFPKIRKRFFTVAEGLANF